MKQDKRKNKKGFTLIEMLVVVLIIGILAGIALPQYQMAVTKAKVASIMPLMRRFSDSLAEFKLRNDTYCPNNVMLNGDELDVDFPNGWACSGYNCWNDYWDCFANEECDGTINCHHTIDTQNEFMLNIFQPDYNNCEVCRGKIICLADGTEGGKVCKALGRKLEEDNPFSWEYLYAL